MIGMRFLSKRRRSHLESVIIRIVQWVVLIAVVFVIGVLVCQYIAWGDNAHCFSEWCRE